MDQRGRCLPLLVLIGSGLNFPSAIISRIARSLVLSLTAASRTLLVLGGFMSVSFLASCRLDFHYVGLLQLSAFLISKRKPEPNQFLLVFNR